MNTALAMALHGRLGKDSAIACIGRETMEEAVKIIHSRSPSSKYYKFFNHFITTARREIDRLKFPLVGLVPGGKIPSECV